MHSLHLVHLSTLHRRDDARVFTKEVKTLAEAFSHQVSYIVADGKGSEFISANLAIHDLGSLKWGRSGRALLGSYRAFCAIRTNKVHSVHFHDPELIPLSLLLKLFGYKVIYDVHEDMPPSIMSREWIPAIFRIPMALSMGVLERLAGIVFDAIVTATPKIGTRFPKNKTVLVQNFPIQSELVATRSVPYKSRSYAFAYVGGIQYLRGAKEMVMALEYFQDEFKPVLEMAGEFSPDGFGDTLRTLPAWSSVNYHGYIGRSEVANLLGGVRAGLVLLHPIPNYLDAYPVKMFEYMAAGLPVIASDFPLWRQIVEQSHCGLLGLLVDPLNPEAIANAMRWILEHPTEAAEMGERGKKIVEEKYNWDHERTKLTNLYKRLLG